MGGTGARNKSTTNDREGKRYSVGRAKSSRQTLVSLFKREMTHITKK